MAQTIQSIRGMNDILPEQSIYWQIAEQVFREVAAQYAYQEIRFPIVEQTTLFKRSIGEATDVVEKEMYTFEDRDGESLTLRPEGTAGCVRASLEHGLLHNQIQRLWYMGPMFRHERPQKGRYRQFHQFGVEAFGMATPDIDAEIIAIAARIWQRLGISEHASLQINSLGTLDERIAYRKVLVEYLQKHQTHLDADSQRRLQTNPMRILDSKNPHMQDLIKQAPNLLEHLTENSLKHFERLQALLKTLNIPFEINPRLVRGLDYYCSTVFEWVTDQIGTTQNAICSGGRYDGLVELLGSKQPVPAIGFALGLERVISILEKIQKSEQAVDIYFILLGDEAETKGLKLAEDIRKQTDFKVLVNCGGGSFKTQFKRADKSGAKLAFIIAEDEIKNDTVSVKFLREDQPQISIPTDQITIWLTKR